VLEYRTVKPAFTHTEYISRAALADKTCYTPSD